MDLEKLNKSQIVLLTLLVSFMTSIATGIVTVSLLQQAPPAITETVNRVVEHTVERVVQGQTASAANVPPEVKTIIVRDSELVPKAVEAVTASVVRIYSNDADSPLFLGLGLVLDGSGLIAVDAAELGDLADTQIELSGGKRVRGFVRDRNASTGLAYISATTTADEAITWTPAALAVSHPALGQSVILISGKSATRVGQGLITAISPLSDGVTDGPSVIETDLPKDGILLGSPIIDTDGNIVGLSTSESRGLNESGFIASAAMRPAPKEKAPLPSNI